MLSKTCCSDVAAPFTSPVINFNLAESVSAVMRAGQARVMASRTNIARFTTAGIVLPTPSAGPG